MKKKAMYISAAVVLLVLLVSGLLLKQRDGASAQQLSAAEASQVLLRQYPGEVLSLHLRERGYLARLRTDQGLYELQLDAASGEVESIVRLELPDGSSPAQPAGSAEPGTAVPGASGPPGATPSGGPEGTPAASATAGPKPTPAGGGNPGQASALPGRSASPAPAATSSPDPTARRVITEAEAVRLALREVPGESDDVDTGRDRSGPFYLIEVNATDGREAVVQVNATSGAIMSVSWEADDDDNT
ncbi:PepSY domain-containing protein [Paenibacillus donghaensis]|uniref:PepSY domain-containing protein n=1 Tax=Paenibacillus donghaensis TaxID=414771 RepID=A0A2Z2KLH4_9BACL|nr:PepSY domain-containing protein [Paenibacillus donghaensis]ASA24243.1 hypothetical protein B9T62_27855 [Paenibacillus donghaensis]